MVQCTAFGQPKLDLSGALWYDVVASLLHTPSIWAVLISFDIRLIKYNGPLEAAHAHIDDD